MWKENSDEVSEHNLKVKESKCKRKYGKRMRKGERIGHQSVRGEWQRWE